MATIADAYVQILPSMQGVQGELQSQMEGPAEKAGSSSGEKAGSAFLKMMTKVITALGIGKLLESAIMGAADLEQSIGGIETLYGTGTIRLEEYGESVADLKEQIEDTASAVQTQALMMSYAENAYKTVGMSANDYMETVTSFSASLIQSLGGDTAAAAEAANQALTDMSDNANKMGTDMSMIQSAYMGFSRQNYTMLDNLKLGYGGTKEEMERLLADASKLSGVKYDINSLSDVYEAIHVIQEETGIAGTTAKEAASTMSGSLSMVKASFTNLLTAMASGDGLAEAMTAFGESGLLMIENFIPTAVNAIVGLVPAALALLNEYGPQLMELASQAITDLITGLVAALPMLITAITGLFTTLIPAIIAQIPTITVALMNALPTIIDGLIQMVLGIVAALPQIIRGFVDAIPTVITSVISALMLALPQLVEGCVQLVIALVGALPEIGMALIDAIPAVLQTLGDTIAENWPTFKESFLTIFNNVKEQLPVITKNFVTAMKEGVEHLGETLGELVDNFLEAAGKWVTEMWNGVKEAWPDLVDNAKEFVEELPDKLIEALTGFGDVGEQIIDGIWGGISDGWSWLTSKVSSLASGLLNAAKSALGIASPSKEFAWVGEMINEGLAGGLEDVAPVEDAMDELIGLTTGTLTADVLTGDIKSVSSGVNGATISRTNTFNIYGAEGQDVMEIANAVKEILTDEFDETEAVFA